MTEFSVYIYGGYEHFHCKECRKKACRDFREKNKERERLKNAAARVALRTEAIARYSRSSSCEICTESRTEFLAIDHTHGGGNRHRKSVRCKTLFHWLKQNEYPDGFRVLCHNCHWKHGVRAKSVAKTYRPITTASAAHKRAYRERYPEKYEAYKASLRGSGAEFRSSVISKLGGECECCHIKDYDVLSVDHIDGGGTRHRAEVGSGPRFYRWLVSNDFPPGFRVLCLNCNMARGMYGTCPHDR